MLDLLTLTATKAQQLLQNGETTSVALVEAYLAQIEKHNHKGMHLNAMISIRPRELLLAEAKRLDDERKAGRVCGPLHGIPFVFKDVFALHPDMGIPVTCGAPCFQSAKPRRTAPLIQRLTNNCGLIALGTANMTEFCGLKFDKLTVGSSPAGGQTQSPYIYGGLETDTKYVVGHSSIGGSSAGSASAVAAGFAPLSIGTECCGSLVLPASRGGLYGLKCGLDMVDVRGAFHFTDVTDYIGGMAKSPSDLAPFVAALMGRTDSFDIRQGLKGLRVGFVDPETWLLPDEYMDYPGNSKQQMVDAFRESQRRFAQAGAEVFEKIDLSSDSDAFDYKGKNLLWEISIYQMRNKSFPAWFNEFEESEVHSVAEMIKWNVDHAEKCLPLKQPYQNHFYDLLHNRISAEECDEFIDAFHKYGDKMNKLFDEMDIIASFTDSGLARYTSAAGSPSACAPLTTVKYSEQNERPFGLCFAARKGNEGLLLRCLAGFEELYPNRPLPKPMMEAET